MQPNGSIVSVNVGQVRTVEWRGRTVTTGIFKSPVAGPVRVAGVAVAGDAQADLEVHGGPEMAVYAYPSEHYAGWREAIPEADFGAADSGWGAFGENLTTRGLLETDVRIGDRLRCGDAELVVTQPRMPCYKLTMRLDSDAVGKRMIETRQTGFYLTIAREGTVRAGDPVELVDRPDHGLTIDELVALDRGKPADADTLRRFAETPGLPTEWRERLDRRAEKL